MEHTEKAGCGIEEELEDEEEEKEEKGEAKEEEEEKEEERGPDICYLDIMFSSDYLYLLM